MNRGMAVIGSIGLGAGLMYLLDPDAGRRRRARIRDSAVHAVAEAENALDKGVRDLNNRAHGLTARASALLKPEPAEDIVIRERVRAVMGRHVSHPHAIEVTCENGCVTLAGPFLASEVEELLDAAEAVRGVRRVENGLAVYPEPDGIPSLQGGRAMRDGDDMPNTPWTPAAKLLVGAVGGALALYGAVRKQPAAEVVGVAGLSLLARHGRERGQSAVS